MAFVLAMGTKVLNAATEGDISGADTVSTVSPEAWTPRPGTVDIFMGVDFNYRDIWLNDNRVFDLLVNLTPGVKWRLPHRWEIAARVTVPVVNQYGDYYKYVRLSLASVSKQFAVAGRWKIKLSGGLFGLQRYGFDWKNMVVINRWLAFTAQMGITGHCHMGGGWTASPMKRITGLAGPEVYLRRWDTQLSLRGGRYVYTDYGVEFEGFRHFRHVSVGAYASYSNKGKENAGFKVIVMLPPYRRSYRKVNFRPASNFRLTYSAEADTYANLNYITEPEQNERTGWFDRDLIPWGVDLKTPDYTVKPRSTGAHNDKKKEAEK